MSTIEKHGAASEYGRCPLYLPKRAQQQNRHAKYVENAMSVHVSNAHAQ